VSADGSVAVGFSGGNAVRWTSSGGIASIGGGEAFGVSGDGTVVVGESTTGIAFRWTAKTGMLSLGVLPGYSGSIAEAISADGAVVVGISNPALSPPLQQAFRWSAPGGMVGVGFLPGQTVSAFSAVSADGSVAVGDGAPFSPGGQEAIIWDTSHGLRSLKQVLTDDGLDLTGWNLFGGDGITPDGNTIVGWGTNPSGQIEGWIATIPEPTTGLLVMAGVLGLAIRRRGQS
jgi:probable HAF family extracellular repeat protein